MKFKSFAVKAIAALGVALSLASCGNSGPGEHDHIWDGGEVTTEATCHSEGVRTFHCTVEGCEQTKTENISMTAHNWDEGKVTTEPTCAATGVKTYTCQNSGCTQTKTETLPKIDHHYAPGELTKIPDLLEKGERELVCNICGDKKKEDVDPHADFTEQFANLDDNWIVCYSSGTTVEDIFGHAVSLDRDGASYKHDNFEITKDSVKLADSVAIIGYELSENAHKISLDINVSFVGEEDATRVEAYYLTYTPAEGFTDPVALHKDAKSWSYTNEQPIIIKDNSYAMLVLWNTGSGAHNGKLSYTLTAKCPHVWDEGVITKQPTEDEEGIKQYTCVKCGEKYEEKIEVLPPSPHKGCISFERDATFFPRFDDEHGTLDLEANAWLTDDGYVAHSEVTKKCADAWRAGMQLNTGVTLVNGHTYEISFNSSLKEELGSGEQFGLILQPRRWASIPERLHFLTSPIGDQKVSIDIDKDLVDDDKPATLWIAVEMGNIENEVTLSDIKVVDKGLTPVPVDPHPERFNFKDKVIQRFEEGVEGNTWLTDFNHVAHIEVSKVHATEVFRGGAFIDTGIELQAEKTYTVSFKTARVNETPFELILQNKQWNEKRLAFFNSPLGDTQVDIQTSHLSAGSLWISIQFGTTVNEITISDLVVTEKGASTPYAGGSLNFTNRVEGRFEGPAGNAWVDGTTNTKAHMEVTRARAEHIWEGKMYINTGITLIEGKNYSVSYKINRTEDNDYEVVLQNGKDGAWIATYRKADEVEGVVNKETGVISAEQAGTLWVTLQSGDQTNNFEFYDLIVTEVGGSGSAIVLTDKIEAYFLGANGSVAVAEDGTNASVNITNAGRESWRGGMFIDTGLNLEAGDYTLSFDSLRDNKWEGYTLILQRNQWDDVEEYAKVFNLRDGSLSIDFTVTSENAGYLWLYVERGSEYNKVTLSNLKVTPKDTTHEGQINLTGKARERFGDGVVGTLGFKDGGYSIDVDIDTRQADKRWAGGTIIHLDDLTGITEEKTYTLSFEASTTERSGTFDFKIGNAEYGAQYANVTIPYGSASIDFVVSGDSPLWLSIECGDVEGKFTLSNLKLAEKDNTHDGQLNLTGKVRERFDDGVVGTLHLTDGGYGVQINITDKDTEIYKGGATIHLEGIEAVGSYTLSFTASFIDRTEEFKVLVGDTQYHNEYGAGSNLLAGDHSITFYAYRTGDYWLTIECGNATGTVTLTNFKVVNNEDPYINLNTKAVSGRDVGTFTVNNEDPHKVEAKLKGASSQKYEAGGFIKFENVSNGAYELSFVAAKADSEERLFNLYIGTENFDHALFEAGDQTFAAHTYQFDVNYVELGDVVIRIECGGTTKDSEFYNFKLVKIANHVDLYGKANGYFYDSTEGNIQLTENNRKLEVNITTLDAAPADYKGGATIDLGHLDAGTYKITFDTTVGGGKKFNLLVGNPGNEKAYDAGSMYTVNSNGRRTTNEFVLAGAEDHLTLRIQCADVLGQITISNIRIIKVA